MAIPACVDPDACGTNVTFNTAGIRVDIEIDNTGCGADLSCSPAGLQASARLLANGGLECDAPSRGLYVDRRGATAAANPTCYNPVNIDTAGGLWTPPSGVIDVFSGVDSGLKQIPVEGGSTAAFDMGSLQAGACDERWIGHFQIQHNITAAANGDVFNLMNFVLDYSGLAPDPSDVVTRDTINFTAAGGTQNANNYIWVPIVVNVPAGQTATFNCVATCVNRDNVAGGAATADNSIVMQGLRITRFYA